MNYYLAPMEGITDYIYRNTLNRIFGGVFRYYTPFITPYESGTYRSRDWNGVLPENNAGISLVPQILTKYAHQFTRTAADLQALGYTEVNLNLGCPSGTVVAKGRGSGFLSHPEELNQFLEDIFSEQKTQSQMKISIKTRIGLQSVDEFPRLLEIYNQYPIAELIIHPRIQKEFYHGTPHRDVFWYALEHSKNPVIYNGDLSDAVKIQEYGEELGSRMQKTASISDTSVMIGRGLLMNPALARQQADPSFELTKEKLREFHQILFEEHREILSGETPLLQHMKEIWFYLAKSFTDNEKYLKKIHKSNRCSEYMIAVNQLFREQELVYADRTRQEKSGNKNESTL